MLSGSGQFNSQQQAQLAQLLANISTGQGTQLSNINQQGGQNQANLSLGQGANMQNLIGNLAGAAGQFQAQQTPALPAGGQTPTNVPPFNPLSP